MGTCFLIKQNDDRMKRKRREALQNLQTCNFFFLLKNTKRSFFFFFFAPSFGNLSSQLFQSHSEETQAHNSWKQKISGSYFVSDHLQSRGFFYVQSPCRLLQFESPISQLFQILVNSSDPFSLHTTLQIKVTDFAQKKVKEKKKH